MLQQAESEIKGHKQDWAFKCQSYENAFGNYTLYCLGYIEPTLEKLRRDQKLVVGKKKMTINGVIYDYEGEMRYNDAHGHGIARSGAISFEGTFFNDRPEGVCRHVQADGIIFDGEWKQGKKWGKMTCTVYKTKTNQTWKDGVKTSERQINLPRDEAFYHKKRPNRALASNWEDFK